MKQVLAVFLLAGLFSAHAALKIGSYNIRNFDYDERSHTPTNMSKLSQTLRSVDADFLGVQEINKTHVFANYISKTFFGRYEVALSECGGAHDQRLGFVYDRSKFELMRFEEDLRVSNPFSPKQGHCRSGSRPLAIGTFKIKSSGKTFVAISVHLKSGGQDRSIRKRFKQLEIIGKALNEYRRSGIDNFIVMGDFNSTEYNLHGQIKERFVSAVNRMGLRDATANLECTSYWWGGRPDGKQYPSQLDHILVSKNFQKSAPAAAQAYGHCARLRCSVTPEERMGEGYDEVSDHCPIAANI